MKIPNVFSLHAIDFKRTEDSEWEAGLLIDNGDAIYDMNGIELDGVVWDYRRRSLISINSILGDVNFDPETKTLDLKIQF